MAAERTLTAVRARDLLNDVLQRVSGEGLRVFTVKEWFDHFAKQKRKSKSEKTALRHEQMHEEFLAFLGPRANLNIAAITQKDFSISETNAKPLERWVGCPLVIALGRYSGSLMFKRTGKLT
jgi:hypothetical protein